jgi:hypothetical protein
MSIHGKIPQGSFKSEIDMASGKVKRTFHRVILQSIGRTTMPVWYPSLGTVLSKAVEEAGSENVMETNAQTPVAAVEPVVPEVPAAVESDIAKAMEERMDRLEALLTKLVPAEPAAVIETEKSVPSQETADAGEIAKAVSDVAAVLAGLVEKQNQTETLVKSLMENTPEGSSPPAITREPVDAAAFKAEFDKLTPFEKLLTTFAVNGITGYGEQR